MAALSLAEELVVEGLLVIPHGRGFEVANPGREVLTDDFVVERDTKAGGIRYLDVALVNDGFVYLVDEILPEGDIQRVVLEREGCRRRSRGRGGSCRRRAYCRAFRNRLARRYPRR